MLFQEISEKGLKAKAWAQVVANQVGGKSGGSDVSAQGAGSDTKNVLEAIRLAKEFAQLNLDK